MLTLALPGLPPGINHAYQHLAGGAKRRTRASVEWQDDTRRLVQNALVEDNVIYGNGTDYKDWGAGAY